MATPATLIPKAFSMVLSDRELETLRRFRERRDDCSDAERSYRSMLHLSGDRLLATIDWMQSAEFTADVATDGAAQARCDALATALRDVLRLCVDRKAYVSPEQQEALWRAQAALVEVGK